MVRGDFCGPKVVGPEGSVFSVSKKIVHRQELTMELEFGLTSLNRMFLLPGGQLQLKM